MRATLGRWEIATNLSEPRGYSSTSVSRFEPEPEPGEAQSAAELEELAGDFITRHVLERDSLLFEG
jgi:hypothetical protein